MKDVLNLITAIIYCLVQFIKSSLQDITKTFKKLVKAQIVLVNPLLYSYCGAIFKTL